MPAGAPAALFVNDIINKHINAGHFQAGCMFNFIFNAVGNALRDGSDVQAIPHFDVQGDDQPPFLLNTRNRTLEKNGQRIKLTQVEYSIMKMFMENPGKALSREEILDLVWGYDYFGELKIVDVNIRRLRLKIEDNATNPTYITTIWGFGYKWGL